MEMYLITITLDNFLAVSAKTDYMQTFDLAILLLGIQPGCSPKDTSHTRIFTAIFVVDKTWKLS